MLSQSGEVEARGVNLYLRTARRRDPALRARCSAGQATSIPSCCARESKSPQRNHRERLSEAGMVDLLGMFRRRPAKRSPPGFARTRADITVLGDSMGEMLASPVRDAPSIARDAPLQLDTPRPVEKPRPVSPPRPKTNG